MMSPYLQGVVKVREELEQYPDSSRVPDVVRGV